MIYSVWSPGSRAYQYYSVGEAAADDTPAPKVNGGGRLGHAPGEATWELPKGATPVGSGPRAKGVVIHLAPTGSLDLGGDKLKWILYAGIAYVALKLFR